MGGRHFGNRPSPFVIIFDVTQQALEASLRGSSMRASALAQNMANINTAGYQRVDVDFQTALNQAVEEADAAGSQNLNVQFGVQPDETAAVREDGSTVDVDQEGAMIAQNALQYQGLTQVMAARRRMMEMAMRTSGT